MLYYLKTEKQNKNPKPLVANKQKIEQGPKRMLTFAQR